MLPLLTEDFGNPSSVHGSAARARAALDEARERLRRALNAEPREIVFTAGGTEAINLALKGVAWAGKARATDSSPARSSTTRCCTRCATSRSSASRSSTLPVDRYGRVDPEQLDAAINDRTILVSLHAGQQRGRHGPAAWPT